MSIPGDNPKRAGMRQMIWAELAKGGPATGSELAFLLSRRTAVIRPRLTELLELGEIRDTGARRRGGPRGPMERVFDIVHKRDQCARCDGKGWFYALMAGDDVKIDCLDCAHGQP